MKNKIILYIRRNTIQEVMELETLLQNESKHEENNITLKETQNKNWKYSEYAT